MSLQVRNQRGGGGKLHYRLLVGNLVGQTALEPESGLRNPFFAGLHRGFHDRQLLVERDKLEIAAGHLGYQSHLDSPACFHASEVFRSGLFAAPAQLAPEIHLPVHLGLQVNLGVVGGSGSIVVVKLVVGASESGNRREEPRILHPVAVLQLLHAPGRDFHVLVVFQRVAYRPAQKSVPVDFRPLHVGQGQGVRHRRSVIALGQRRICLGQIP